MTKLRVPSGCGFVSHRGCSVAIGSDGLIDVDDVTASVLLAHGFTQVTQAKAISTPLNPESNEVANLSRNELFAFLRRRGVSVSLPITNESLRAAARAALLKVSE
jgi:hypothetical protein